MSDFVFHAKMLALYGSPLMVPVLVAILVGLDAFRAIFGTPSWWWFLIPGVPFVALLPALVYFILSMRGLSRL